MGIQFDKCIKDGGKVKTETVSKTQYRRTCEIEGTVHRDKIRTKKK